MRDPERQRGDLVEELLDALEEVPEDRREAQLMNLCADPELRREVWTLLSSEPEARSFVDGLADRLSLKSADAGPLVGKRIGAYRLSRMLGRGGMGVVYEAERADGVFEQRVALKLLTAALAGTEARVRFSTERQILAELTHPAIARVVDGGVTDDDTPWFAMERVEGEPIDAFCDRRRLGVRERIELFLQVCDAVEHAHRHLVVHRDLKPGNVLVTDDRRVKLLDFGIAKLLGLGSGAPAAPATSTVSRLMTPEYASPEQLRGAPITTASDVYQLGLLLYELLTGRRPYVLRQRSAGELEHAICEQAPVRPSAAILREDARQPSEDVCHTRRTSGARLRRHLRGDLENIVLQALRKEPERRYGSADRLAQDIRRHLAGLPVTARPDTWSYRSWKFLQRHALATGTVLIVLLLAGGMAAFHTARIQKERDRARAEAAKAQQLSQFVTGLFRTVDPREARGAEVTARELLDHGVEQANRELAGQPVVRAEILHVLGRTYLEIGLYDDAETLLTRSLEMRWRHLGSWHPDVAATWSDLGLLRYTTREYERARSHLYEAIHILERSPDNEAPRLVAALILLGRVHRNLGEHKPSLDALERALSIQRRVAGAASATEASILHSMGVLSYLTSDAARAEHLFEQALAIQERELGADHPQVGSLLANLALARWELGRTAGLEALHRRNLAIQSKAYGPRHPRVAMALNNLGEFLALTGRHEEAVPILRRAVRILRATLGASHTDVAVALLTLGDAYFAVERREEARNCYQESVTIRESRSGLGQAFDPVLFHGLVGLGRAEAALENHGASRQALERALASSASALDSDDPRLTPSVRALGEWLAGERRCSEAVPLLSRSLDNAAVGPPATVAEVEAVRHLLADCSQAGNEPGDRAADAG